MKVAQFGRVLVAEDETVIVKAEDAAHASGDYGLPALVVRKDTAASLAGTDGDYSLLIVDASGRLHVAPLPANSGVDIGDVDVLSIAAGTNVVGKVRLVTATGDEITEDTDNSINVTLVADDVGIGGGTQYTEGAIDATITGNVMMAEAPSDTIQALQVDASKHLQVDIAADSVGIGGGTQYAEDAVHTTGDTGTLALVVRKDTAAQVAGTDGDYSVLITDASGRLHIAPLAANSGVDIGDVDVLTEPSGSGAYTTPTHTAPSIAATTTEALASNASRLYALLINDSDAVIYIKLGAAAVMNQGIRLNASGGNYEMSKKLGNLYTGAINGISAAGSKILLVLEGV